MRILILIILINILPGLLVAQVGKPVMIVEIPAGTNLKYEFDKESGEFRAGLIDGKPRRIDFLSYPGNYGFISNTLMDKSQGGDGDALDVLLIGESVSQGTEIEILPLALLHLLDGGEIDDKIIAVPADPEKRIIRCESYQCLVKNYPGILEILKTWFTQYKGPGIVSFSGWEDEQAAVAAIRKWHQE